MLNRQVVISEIELARLERATCAQCEPAPQRFNTKNDVWRAQRKGQISAVRAQELLALFDHNWEEDESPPSAQATATSGGQDMGDLLMAQLDAEHAAGSREPAPKIETRQQAIETIKKFEANKSDLGDLVMARDLREQFGIWEVL